MPRLMFEVICTSADFALIATEHMGAVTTNITHIFLNNCSPVRLTSNVALLNHMELINLTVDGLEKLNIEQPLSDQTAPQDENNCMILKHTVINTLYFLKLKNCKGTIQKSEIGQIAMVEANHLNISSTNIKVVYSKGINITNGSLLLSNVHIDHLYRNAFVLTGSSEIHLQNVTIHRCDSPCFDISNTTLSSVKNCSTDLFEAPDMGNGKIPNKALRIIDETKDDAFCENKIHAITCSFPLITEVR